MNELYFLLYLAIAIPGLALLGHLYVAYKYAPERAKQAVLDALVKDQAFQEDLIKTLLNNLFREVREGEKSIVPIDMIIDRAKKAFTAGIKDIIPGSDNVDVVPMMTSQDEYGNPIQDMTANMLLSQIPKKWRGPAMLFIKYMMNK